MNFEVEAFRAVRETVNRATTFYGFDESVALIINPTYTNTATVHRLEGAQRMTIHSASEFISLRTSDDLDEQRRAGLEPVAEGVFEELITHHPEMREWVAYNKTVPLEILRILARDEDDRVRGWVAMKRKLTVDILEMLVDDPDDAVRMSVARHRRTSRELLEKLVNDPWEEVRKVARSRLADE